MSILTDWEYAEDVARFFPRFKRVGKKFNFRCPICGDSDKDAFKARGWVYEHAGKVRIGCFNCNANMTIGYYLKEYQPEMYRKYLMAKMKDSSSGSYVPKHESSVPYEPEKKFTQKLYVEKLQFCERLDTLPANHPIIKYVSDRHIPTDKYSLLWFTKDWRKLVNSINPETYKKDDPEPRLVIPIFTADKKIESFQGRALRKQDIPKYVTIKTHEDASKIYGLDRVDEKKSVFFLEGPIDSLFVDNGCAITGGQLGLDRVPFKDNRVWVMDNEPYAVETCKRIKKLIDANEKVVLFDNISYNFSKDINEMIANEGASINEINAYLNANIVSGLTAKLRFNKWRKV